jgi:hypothetical protein
MTHSCQARILTTSFLIPGTADSCFNTTDCKKPAPLKITVDDGDAFMPICKECFTRFKSRTPKNSNTWYGWFDCDYPPDAHIKGSKWYHDKVKEGKTNPVPASASAPAPAPAVAENKSVTELTAKMDTMTLTTNPKLLSSAQVDSLVQAMGTLQIAAQDPKQDLQDQIQAIEAWMKGEGKLKFKEQPKKLRELMTLRAKLKLLK